MTRTESCPRIEALSALVDDVLADAERAALEEHVRGCPLCAPALADFRALRFRFQALPEPTREVDIASVVDRRIAALARPSAAPATRVRPRWWQVALLAPGGAAAVGAGLWLGAAMMPAAAQAPEPRMAVFSAMPPGAVCPAVEQCREPL
jgi:anti-sigma factor RsiW